MSVSSGQTWQGGAALQDASTEAHAFSGLELLSEHACFGGTQRFYRHNSREIGLSMRFGLFLPPQALAGQKVPMLTFLAGLTCTEETFAIKAGAQAHAAQLGLAILTPDTSPRGARVAGESDAWDFGVGAGFYLDAAAEPWAQHWRMESYLMVELLPAVQREFELNGRRQGIFGHSMGGHGALTLALRHPGRFASVSSFSPICAPTQCPWGRKAFAGYLGGVAGSGGANPPEVWAAHDASDLMARQTHALLPSAVLIDQGLADQFLKEQLYPECFEAACQQVGQALTLRRHAGYDHGYYFVASFVADHLAHHAHVLKR